MSAPRYIPAKERMPLLLAVSFRPVTWAKAMKKWILLFAIAVSVSNAPGSAAHHSLAGVYEVAKEIVIEGTIESFEFVNPHPYLLLKVDRKGAGKPEQWKLELDNLYELKEIGVTAKTFRSGDRVTVKGHPGHNDARTLYVRRLDRPADNFRYEQPDQSPIIGKIPRP